MSDKYYWTKVWDCGSKEPDGSFSGHTVFRDEVTGRYAIADMSGDTPDKTDDGVLWIDCERPIKFCLTDSKSKALAEVPVLDKYGDTSHTLTAIPKLERLLAMLPSLTVSADKEMIDMAERKIEEWQSVLRMEAGWRLLLKEVRDA
jgi:hypothetical protein